MKIASYAQEAIWISSQFAPDCPLYNETVTVRFPAMVDPMAMEAALRALIARHDILRTAFLEDATGVPHQRLTDSAPLVLRWSDLSTSPMPDRERTAARLAELDVAEPFDLARPPLLRARLVRFGPADTRLYLNLHHLIFDAHTLHHVLLPDLRAFLEGRPPPHSLPAANHLDYAAWERSWCTDAAMKGELAWWMRNLDGAIFPSLHGFPASPRPKSYCGADLPAGVPARSVTGLRFLAGAQGATLPMALLAAFAAALRRRGGPDDLVILIVDSGRGPACLEHLAGCLVNSLLIRLDLRGRPPARTLLSRVRSACVDAYSRRRLPFMQLVAAQMAQGRPALHHIAFVIEPEPGPGLGHWTLEHFATPTHTAKFCLSLLLEHSSNGLAGRLNFDTDDFSVDHGARLLDEFHSVLDAMVALPDEPLWPERASQP